MGANQVLALIETELAALARAEQAIKDLQRIGLILCWQRWTIALAERYEEDLQDVAAGLAVNGRWMSQLRSQGVCLDKSEDRSA